jgi:WD40 repeat protein
VWLWRLADGTERAVLTGHTGRVRGCAFSPDGALLATTGADWAVRLWRVADGAERAVLTAKPSGVNGCRLASGLVNASLYWWPAADVSAAVARFVGNSPHRHRGAHFTRASRQMSIGCMMQLTATSCRLN